MTVKRIVADIHVEDTVLANKFYGEILGLEVLMDLGWIVTYGLAKKMSVQISFATQGGSDTPVPDISIEVDDLDKILRKMIQSDFRIEYGPINEPWGVRRFFVRDPFGKLVNILSHN